MDEVKDSTLSEEIDRLHAEHRRYAQRLEELIQKPYLSEDEQLEEVRLKKLKLHAKDLISLSNTAPGDGVAVVCGNWRCRRSVVQAARAAAAVIVSLYTACQANQPYNR